MVTAILIAPELTGLTNIWIYFMSFLWWSAATAAILTTLIYIRLGTRYIEQFENHANNSEQNSVAGDDKREND